MRSYSLFFFSGMQSQFVLGILLFTTSLVTEGLESVEPISPSELQQLVIRDKYAAHIQAPYYLTSRDQPPPQNPSVWKALRILKGRKRHSDDYPQLEVIPKTDFSCTDVNQAGFYADQDAECQVIRRCDPGGELSSFLCPIQTIFNQITLVCDWWYNVDCSQSKRFRDYSNPRLYHPNWSLLDDDIKDYVEPMTTTYPTSESEVNPEKVTVYTTKRRRTKKATHSTTPVSTEPTEGVQATTEEPTRESTRRTKRTTTVSTITEELLTEEPTTQVTSTTVTSIRTTEDLKITTEEPTTTELEVTSEELATQPTTSTTVAPVSATEEITTKESTSLLTTGSTTTELFTTIEPATELTTENIISSTTETGAVTDSTSSTRKPGGVCNVFCKRGDRCVIRRNKPRCARIEKLGRCPSSSDVNSSAETCTDDADCEFDLKCCQSADRHAVCSERE